jgi:hypothetical protein
MLKDNRELWWALTAIIIISGVYAAVAALYKETPAASGLFGHSIGVLGFILMLSTETLYSLRKRSRLAKWGQMSTWLRVHIFTGIVGPYMVLLHTSWRFHGLAGITLLLTVLIVISGFIGRYIFTAVPRTADGIEVEKDELLKQIEAIEEKLYQGGAPLQRTGDAAAAEFSSAAPAGSVMFISGKGEYLDKQFRSWIRIAKRGSGQEAQQAREMEKLIRRRSSMQKQITSLTNSRRLLSIWHSVHIPIGMALFTAAFIHAAAAFYYATLLR